MLKDIFNVVSFIGAAQGIFLAAIFLRKNGNHPATRNLAAYTFIFSLGLLEPYLDQALQGWIRRPVLSFLSISNFLYGPLLYLFVFFLTSENPRFKRREWNHFLPFAVLLIADASFWLLGKELLTIDAFQLVAFELLIVQILTYNVLAIRRLSRHQKKVLMWYPSVKMHDLKWLKFLLVWITAIYGLSFIISHILLLAWQPAADLYLLIQLGITLSIFMMTYRLIFQPQVFVPLKEPPAGGGTPDPRLPKYLKSGLKPERAEEYLRSLKHYMNTEKPYLEPDLTLYSLGEKLKISRNHLTQVINEKLGKNFYDYINEHRVEEVKSRMHDLKHSHLSLAGIGLEAGFKSKSAFNFNFKKMTGHTPTEWKRKNMAAPIEKNV